MNETVSNDRSRAALKRLLIVAGFAIVLVIFSYGWTVTDINLARPQEPQRQQNVGNALRELLSPNVFTQNYEIINATTSFVMGCPADFAPPQIQPPADGSPYIVVTPACGSSNEIITVEGFNFGSNQLARINWIATDGERRIRRVVDAEGDNFITRADGSFSVQIEVPRIRGTSGQTHTIETQGRIPIGAPQLSETTRLVAEKMLETIFLALIATALSILPSAILSFFAAHNLMRPIRMTLGSLLVMFIALPIGYAIGAALLGQLGAFAVGLGSGSGTSAAAAGGLFVVAAVASTRRLSSTLGDQPNKLGTVVKVLITAATAVFVFGLIGGLGLWFERTFTGGVWNYVGNLIGTLGELVRLLIVPIGGIVGAFALSSIATTLTRSALKALQAPVTHILGAVLGGIAGAFLMAVCAVISMNAAWLGLIPPVAAAAVGAQILPSALMRTSRIAPSPSYRAARLLLSLISAAVVFMIAFQFLGVSRAVIEGTLPMPQVAFQIGEMVIYDHVARSMLVGAALGVIGGALGGTKANFPIGSVLYNITRTVLNGLRSIEPLIMGLVFVIWVGIGPFAGVLALTLHSIASLGKLYSEQIENIDSGPIEALESTGANRLQTIMYAVVPQIIPPYIAFTMYRWDINVRMSTIIGFVGGGGVGFLLQQQINLLRYRDAGVAVLAIAIVVSILDYASASIRARYT